MRPPNEFRTTVSEMLELPIDAVLADVREALACSARLVLEAPPGAGKTTRVPWDLARAAWCPGRVLVSEPRRIAARLAARRVCEERGFRLGAEVGYQVRFEDVTSRETRVVYLTEGILLRRLVEDPLLAGVDCVILDELHERSLDADLCLALLERLQREHRPDLRILAMSATLNAEEVASYLHGCPTVRSEGRSYPIELRHAPRPDERPLEKQVRSAVREALQDGNVLVFLPGAAEIRRCQEALTDLGGAKVLVLHGDLPLKDQVRAVTPDGTRRVVLATNVAESSVTIPDVATVIDSGLARVARHSPWSGLRSLELEEISQARAAQRAGRAGRTRAGLAVRLYTAGNHSARRRQDPPAIEREDLSGALLCLAASEGATPDALRWLTPPPRGAWQAAVSLLECLDALRDGRLTEIGRRMLQFPLHPRLARLLVEGEHRGCAERACLAAALLAERDIRHESRTPWSSARPRHGETGDSDLDDMADRFHEAAAEGFSAAALRRLDLDPSATRAVDATYHQLRRQVRDRSQAPESDESLARCLLAAFNDRVAQRRGTGRELLLCGGATAVLAETSVVHRAPWLVALAADRPRGKSGAALVRIASRIEPDWLLDAFADRIELDDLLALDSTGERVERTTRMRFGRLVLDESRTRAEPSSESAELLCKAARAKGGTFSDPGDALARLTARLELLLTHGLVRLDTSPVDLADESLRLGCEQVTSLAELAKLDMAALALATLPEGTSRTLREHAPERIRLPSGRELPVHYERGKAPWIQSRLQDFFGMIEAPSICLGRIPLLLHLLAPNQRPVQVTTDLAGFWQKHYPALRRELMRRYPRHSWPEDGRSASPPAPRPTRPR